MWTTHSGTQVIPDTQGNIHTLRSPYTPISGKQKDGTLCLDKIKEIDGIYWTSNLVDKDFSEEEDLNDGIILEFEKPNNAQTAKVMVSFKDTRLAERITYNVTRLPADFPKQRSMLLNSLRQLRLEVWNGTQWVSEGTFLQPGPFIGRDSIKLIDVSGISGDRIKIKLEAVTGAVLIDSVKMDYSADEAVISSELRAAAAVKADGMDVASEILSDDDNYLVLEQGDFAYLDFNELASNSGHDRSYIVKAKGYYDSPLLEPLEGEAYEELLNEFLADFSYAASYYLKMYASGVEHCGINLNGSSNNTISRNEIYDNYPEEGIYLQNSNSNVITENCIHDNGHGIWLYNSDNNKINLNGIFDNFREEISLPNVSAGIRNGNGSSGNVMQFNNIYGNSVNEPNFGVYNDNSAEEVNASNNWWGANNGPSPVGHGDKVSDGVDYNPWLNSQVRVCAQVKVTMPPLPPLPTQLKPFDDGDSSPSMPTQTWAKPADVKILTASVSPSQVAAGQPVTIFANVTNKGDMPGMYTATLKINGQVAEVKQARWKATWPSRCNSPIRPPSPGSMRSISTGRRPISPAWGRRQSSLGHDAGDIHHPLQPGVHCHHTGRAVLPAPQQRHIDNGAFPV